MDLHARYAKDTPVELGIMTSLLPLLRFIFYCTPPPILPIAIAPERGRILILLLFSLLVIRTSQPELLLERLLVLL